MKKYSFTCTCGDKLSVEAMDEAEAKTKLAEMMPEEGMKAHFADKHAGQEVPGYTDFMASVVMAEEPAEMPAA